MSGSDRAASTVGRKKRKTVETESESQDSVFGAVDTPHAKGGRLLLVVDESHYGAKSGATAIKLLARMLPDLVVEMSATPDDKPHRSLASAFRSKAEVGTEELLDAHPVVLWWAKNGDRGSDYFSVPCIDEGPDGSLELGSFYPDCVPLLSRADGGRTVAIVEAKREEEANHNPRQTELKAKWLQRHLMKANEYAAGRGDATPLCRGHRAGRAAGPPPRGDDHQYASRLGLRRGLHVLAGGFLADAAR